MGAWDVPGGRRYIKRCPPASRLICSARLQTNGSAAKRLFRGLSGYRRIATRSERRDVIYRAFLNVARFADKIEY